MSHSNKFCSQAEFVLFILIFQCSSIELCRVILLLNQGHSSVVSPIIEGVQLRKVYFSMISFNFTRKFHFSIKRWLWKVKEVENWNVLKIILKSEIFPIGLINNWNSEWTNMESFNWSNFELKNFEIFERKYVKINK